MLSDQHILKMGIESAQMLSTAHWVNGSSAPYKKTHVNHPCSKWVRSNILHYRWLVKHALSIMSEYTKRYGKSHKTQTVLEFLRDNEPALPTSEFTEPPLAMPEVYKVNDVVASYRNFYISEKVLVKGLNWKKANRIPEWVIL